MSTEELTEPPSRKEYFYQYEELIHLFSKLAPTDRWFVLVQEGRPIWYCSAGLLFGRFLVSLFSVAHAQSLGSPTTIFGLTHYDAKLISYWAIDAVFALFALGILLHLILAKRPAGWAKDTFWFLIGFLAHTAVPFPTD